MRVLSTSIILFPRCRFYFAFIICEILLGELWPLCQRLRRKSSMEKKWRSKRRFAWMSVVGYRLIRNLREKCRRMVEELHQRQKDFQPGFAVVQVGNREDSNVYIRHKLKAAEEIGIQARLVRLDASTTEQQVCIFPSLHFTLIFIVGSTNRIIE